MAAELAWKKRVYRLCLSCFERKLEVRIDYLDAGRGCCGNMPNAIISMPVARFSIARSNLKMFEPEIHWTTQAVTWPREQGIVGRVYARLLYHGARPTWAREICQQLEIVLDQLETQVYGLDPDFSGMVEKAFAHAETLHQPVAMIAAASRGRLMVSTFEYAKYQAYIQCEVDVDIPRFVACELTIAYEHDFIRSSNCMTADDVRLCLLGAFEQAGIDIVRQETFGPEIIRDICAHKF